MMQAFTEKKSIGLESQIHWSLKSNPLDSKVKSIGVLQRRGAIVRIKKSLKLSEWRYSVVSFLKSNAKSGELIDILITLFSIVS